MSQHAIIHQLERIRSKQPWLVLSAADRFSVAQSDNPAISHFYRFEANEKAADTFAIPDGCVDVLFDCDGSRPEANVFGTVMTAGRTELIPSHRYFGVRFASGVIPDCLAVSAQELIGHHYSFADVVPNGADLFQAIVEQDDFAGQVASFRAFFAGKSTRKLSNITRFVVDRIFAHQGNIQVQDIADEIGYSTRTLQRQFQADLGMSPKQFGRIIRCQSAVYHINHHSAVEFSDMAYDLGFSDQAHFQKEFKKLVHATPMNYLKQVKHDSYLQRIQHF